MASTGRQILGDRYGEPQVSYEDIRSLGLRVVAADGEIVDPEEMRGLVFRVEDPDEPSGYLVRSMEDEEAANKLYYLQKAE